ncbi:hypothetical protein DSM25558_3101 [Agrobacterium sp. DSM 25558]|uniref:Uncharacterized protein n=1 Tax=Agrobacterium rosae TaxID=1972867 RepID=A0A1R3U9Q5_9HYPH|nr:hypothetical protein DSM25558_3101 [Agrobacterium sp. DSM 25558]SCX35669.1 hypothetical protein DSM25559_5086 [Agrobacterium rosae]
MIILLRQAGVINFQKRIGCANDPVRLQRELGLKRNSIPKAVGNEMVEAVILAWSEPFRHRPNTFAVSGADKSRNIKWTHLSSFLVSKLFQKRPQKG